jgi:hypothetical protein
MTLAKSISQRRAEIEAFETDTRTPQRARRELNVVVVGRKDGW